MPSFRDGSTNILALNNPGAYVDNILPTPFIQGVPTNIEGIVGVGSWGPLNAQQFFSTPSDNAGIYGVPQVRPYDLATYVQTAVKQGSSVGFCGVRVSDGTDTAASVSIGGSAGTMSAKYTGSLGNKIAFSFQNTTAAGAYAAVISFPSFSPERFDNLFQAICAVNVTPGSGYTAVPTLSTPAPTGLGGVQAQISASLAAIGVPTVAQGGTGHVVNDVLTLGAGVTVKVTAVTAGAVTSATIVNAGSITSGVVPSTVGAQISSTGAGTGAAFTLLWGLGPATFTSGFNYKSAPTIMMAGGGTPTQAGSYTAVVSFWAALAYAISNGTAQRGPSKCVIFSPGIGTAVPTLNSPVTLAGGTDGAAGITTADMIGVDINQQRTGMYALRSSGCSDFALCDLTDPTTCATQIAFGIEEAMMPVFSTASGDSIEGAVTARANNGIDDPSLWFIEGDWPTVYDDQNGLNRLVSPQAVALGLLGNLSPEQSPINKPLIPVIATESSQDGIVIADADESQAQTGGIDLIGRSIDLGATYFSFLTGRNASSNTAANGVEYTRLTNFLIRSLQGVATRNIVGKLQSIQANDPTRTLALSVLNTFLTNLQNPAAGSGGYGLIDTFSVQCDLSNNPPSTQALGFLFAFVTVRYLNVVRYFVIKLAGGGNVSVTSQDSTPSVSQLVG